MIVAPSSFILASGPTATLTILHVIYTATNTVQITFSDPVTIDTGVSPDTGFRVGARTVVSVSAISSTVIEATMSSDVLIGATWTLNSQPNWLVTPAVLTESGTVLVRIDDVTEISAGVYALTFSSTVAATAGVTSDTKFKVDAVAPTLVTVGDSVTINLTIAAVGGSNWALTGQPAWLTTLVKTGSGPVS